MKLRLLGLVALLGMVSVPKVFAETRLATEEQFHELFVTAGYSTAFGAALGAAVLGLQANPSGKLRYVAFGASLGFIAGSVLGSYLLISPALISDSNSTQSSLAAEGPSLRKQSASMSRENHGLSLGVRLVSF